MQSRPILFSTVGMLFLSSVSFAADTPLFDLSGQVRTRTMFNKPSTGPGSDPNLSTGLRSRLAVTAKPSETVHIRIEAQDSRNFGSEPEAVSGAHHTASIGNAQGIDLHQAYFRCLLGPVAVTGGRQKIKLGSQRFISSLEWHPNARVFDGLSTEYVMSEGAAKLTGLLLGVRDSSATAIEDYLTLSGIHYQRKINDAVNFETYFFYDKSGPKLKDYDYFHIGGRFHGKAGLMFYDEEFIWLAGSDPGGEKAAFYNATRAGISLRGGYKIGTGFDMMSGDDSPAREGTYVANYFFAHAYFGWMDYFVVNPQTGVMDIRLDLDLPLHDRLLLKSQNHYMLQANPVSGADDPYGIELDLEAHGAFFPKSNIVLGGAIFLPDRGMGMDDEAAWQLYLMPIFNF